MRTVGRIVCSLGLFLLMGAFVIGGIALIRVNGGGWDFDLLAGLLCLSASDFFWKKMTEIWWPPAAEGRST